MITAGFPLIIKPRNARNGLTNASIQIILRQTRGATMVSLVCIVLVAPYSGRQLLARGSNRIKGGKQT